MAGTVRLGKWARDSVRVKTAEKISTKKTGELILHKEDAGRLRDSNTREDQGTLP